MLLQITQQLKAKAWADVVESLIGCIYLEAGENAAMEFLVYLGIIPELPIGFQREPTVQIAEANLHDGQLAADIAAAETAAAALDLAVNAEHVQEAAQAAAPADVADVVVVSSAAQDTATAANSHATDTVRPGGPAVEAQAAVAKASAASDQSNSAAAPGTACINTDGRDSIEDNQTHVMKATNSSFHTAVSDGLNGPIGDQTMNDADGMNDSVFKHSHSNGHATDQAAPNGVLAATQNGIAIGTAQSEPAGAINPPSGNRMVKAEPQNNDSTTTDAWIAANEAELSDPNVNVISDDEDQGPMQSGYQCQSGYGAISDADESDSAEQPENPEEIEIGEEQVEGEISLPCSLTHIVEPMEVDPPLGALAVTDITAPPGDVVVHKQLSLGPEIPVGKAEHQIRMDAMDLLAMPEDSDNDQPQARPANGRVRCLILLQCSFPFVVCLFVELSHRISVPSG